MLSARELFEENPAGARLAAPALVYQGSGFLAVYKPPCMHCAPQSGGEPPAQSLASWVFERWPEAASAGPGPEGGLIHRIDYGTSGLVLFALDRAAYAALRAEQERDGIAKEYLLRCSAAPAGFSLPGSRPGRGRPSSLSAEAWETALAGGLGCPPADASNGRAAAASGAAAHAADGAAADGAAADGPLRFPLEVACRFRPYGPAGARVACLGPGEPPPRGRRAHGTPERLYRTLILSIKEEERAGGAHGDGEERIFECRARITRGFRHQIRAQFAWLGLPLIGDESYGGKRSARLNLHAAVIEFASPGDGELLHIEF